MKNGFSLIELLITLAIVGLVLTFGAPQFNGAMQNSRLVSQANAMKGTIAYARTAAVKGSVPTVTLCGSSDLDSCNTAEWELGWIIFEDLNSGGLRTNNEDILRVGEALNSGNTLRTFGFTSDQFIRFDRAGTLNQSGTFVFCDSRGTSEARAIVVNISGKTRKAIDEDAVANHIVNDHQGDDVACI